MKKWNHIALSALTLMMLLGLRVSVHASESNDVEAQILPEGTIEAQILPEGTYEGEQLQTVAEMLGCEMVTEDGYVLTSISITLENSEGF